MRSIWNQGSIGHHDDERNPDRPKLMVKEGVVTVPMDCTTCTYHSYGILSMDDLSRMAQHQPIGKTPGAEVDIIKTTTGYLLHAYCPKCYGSYKGEGRNLNPNTPGGKVNLRDVSIMKPIRLDQVLKLAAQARGLGMLK